MRKNPKADRNAQHPWINESPLFGSWQYLRVQVIKRKVLSYLRTKSNEIKCWSFYDGITKTRIVIRVSKNSKKYLYLWNALDFRISLGKTLNSFLVFKSDKSSLGVLDHTKSEDCLWAPKEYSVKCTRERERERERERDNKQWYRCREWRDFN